MKIVVCGDSWCSADRHLPGTHFSELLQARGHDVINIARGGATNALICFQLQTAHGLEPQLVLYNSTDAYRINVPLKGSPFVSELGLKNFVYPYRADQSWQSPLAGDSKAAIWSDVAQVIVQGRSDLHLQVDDNVKQAIKWYLSYLHCYEFQTVCDSWMLGYWSQQLTAAGIVSLDLTQNAIGQILFDYAGPKDLCNYHTDPETQRLFVTALIDYFNTQGLDL